MDIIVGFILFVIAVAITTIFEVVPDKKANKTPYKEFMSECKRFIDKGDYKRLCGYINRHYRLRILYRQEIFADLEAYARKVEKLDEIQETEKEVT